MVKKNNIKIFQKKVINNIQNIIKYQQPKILKSARNIPNFKIIEQEGANAYDLLKYKNVIFTTSSIKSLQQRISNEKI